MCEKEGKPLPLRGTASRAPCGNKNNGVFFQSEGRCLFRVGLQCWWLDYNAGSGLDYDTLRGPRLWFRVGLQCWVGPGPNFYLFGAKSIRESFSSAWFAVFLPFEVARRCSRCPAFTFKYYNTQSRIDKKNTYGCPSAGCTPARRCHL